MNEEEYFIWYMNHNYDKHNTAKPVACKCGGDKVVVRTVRYGRLYGRVICVRCRGLASNCICHRRSEESV